MVQTIRKIKITDISLYVLMKDIVNHTKVTLVRYYNKFFNETIKESEKEFNNYVAMNKKDNEDFKISIKCWICKKAYEGSEVRVKDHDHIIGKY